jgi:ATP-dependent Clp protease ATP-binding subunit ClpA
MVNSKSLILAWEIAARETIETSAEEISPSHLLIGLCKVCDLKIPEIEEEVQGLLNRLSNNDPQQLRRRLRSLLITPNAINTPERKVHRSQESKHVFQRAEEIAQSKGSSSVLPEHLLQAILEPIDSPLADRLTQLGLPNLYEEVFSDEIDNDDRLRREAVRSVLDQVGCSDTELQNLLVSYQASNPSKTLELLQNSGESDRAIKKNLIHASNRALDELMHSPKVRKIVVEVGIDVLTAVFAPLGISARAINILLKKSEAETDENKNR